MGRMPAPRCLPLFLCLSLSHGLTVAQGAPSQAGFSIKEERPETGSNIRRDNVSGGALPYDKKYGELTPEQQRVLKSRYVEMGEGDEPPFPLEGLGPLYAAIAKANDVAGTTVGILEMEVYVDEEGSTTKVELVRSPDARLSKYVATIAMLTRFKPALCKGKPCAMGFPVRISFVRR